jgi:hypothetical protein
MTSPSEKYTLTVDKEYYQKHYDIFKPPNTEIKSVTVLGEDHKDDKEHGKLLHDYLEAKKRLRDYEFDKRYNAKNK